MGRAETEPMSGLRITFVVLVTLQVTMALWASSPVGVVLAVLAIALVLPWPFFFETQVEGKKVARAEHIPLRRWLTRLAIVLALASFIASVSAHSNTPEGKAASAKRERERRMENAMDAARERAEQVAEDTEREKERAFGGHCFSTWDGSYRPLVQAVEPRLRNPDSFEHVETHGTRIDANGNHRIIMSFRAENGFGGLNLGTASALVRSEDCTMISWKFEE